MDTFPGDAIEELARERLGFGRLRPGQRRAAGERAEALLASCDSGTFVFLSPEQLANPEAREALRRARPWLFAVEAPQGDVPFPVGMRVLSERWG